MKFATCRAIFSTIDLPPPFIVGVIVFDEALNLKAGILDSGKETRPSITAGR